MLMKLTLEGMDLAVHSLKLVFELSIYDVKHFAFKIKCRSLNSISLGENDSDKITE